MTTKCVVLLVLCCLFPCVVPSWKTWWGHFWEFGTQDPDSHQDPPRVIWQIPNVKATAGKFFKYAIPRTVFKGNPVTIMAKELGTSSLPKWLYFNQTGNVFQGVPTTWNIGATNIEVTVLQTSTTTTFQIQVSSQVTAESSLCEYGGSHITAHIILNTYMDKILALSRINLFHRLSDFAKVNIRDVNMEPKKHGTFTNQLTEKMVIAGPGDSPVSTESNGVVISWILGCGETVDYKDMAIILEHNIKVGRLYQELGYNTTGWYITQPKISEKELKFRRLKRQITGQRTPIATSVIETVYPTKLSNIETHTVVDMPSNEIMPTRVVPTIESTHVVDYATNNVYTSTFFKQQTIIGNKDTISLDSSEYLDSMLDIMPSFTSELSFATQINTESLLQSTHGQTTLMQPIVTRPLGQNLLTTKTLQESEWSNFSKSRTIPLSTELHKSPDTMLLTSMLLTASISRMNDIISDTVESQSLMTVTTYMQESTAATKTYASFTPKKKKVPTATLR